MTDSTTPNLPYIPDLCKPVYISIDKRFEEEGIILDEELYPEFITTELGIYEVVDGHPVKMVGVNTGITNFEEFILSDFDELIAYGKSVAYDIPNP